MTGIQLYSWSMGKTCSRPLFSYTHKFADSFSTAATAAVAAPQGSFIALCGQGHLKQAFDTHFTLVLSDPPLLSHFLKTCVELRSVSLARLIHCIIVTGGCSERKFVANHLMNVYAKLGLVEQALKVFEKMPERNVMSCNILIDAYIRNGELGPAIEVFKEMRSRNSASWNAVIAGMIKHEYNDDGLMMFATMHAVGVLPDVYTLSSVLRGCAGLKDLETGEQVHGYVVKSGLILDLVIGSSTAHMYMRCGRLTECEKVIHSMPFQNIVACNTLIAGLVQNGDASGSLDQYYVMRMAGLQPDRITFVSAISSCSDLSTLGQGQQIHTEVVKAGAMSVPAVVTSLISMYSRCGCLDDAVRVFGERQVNEDDFVLWSSMIAAYGYHGRGEEAIELFNRMELKGLEANNITFLNLLYSCSHSGLKDEGLALFDLMVTKYRMVPQVKHYTCVVDLLGRAGSLVEAEGLIRTMPVKPDKIIWKTLLSACKIHRNTVMAAVVAEEILKIDPLDSASYVLLSNTQASAKKWLDAGDVRRTMKDRMIRKEPGVSWFELKNQVHQFIVGDHSHPQWEKIDSYLNELVFELRSRGYAPETAAVLHDMDFEEKEYNLSHHTEKVAVAFALMNTPDGVPVRIMKNLRVCDDCHVAMKYISMVRNREIIIRDSSRFHHFKSGHCSCGEYW